MARISNQPLVMIVDDDSTLRLCIKSYLEALEMQIIEAEDGLLALELIREEVDLIVLDAYLPKIDGFAFCKKIKSDERYKNIPVLMMTGMADDKSIRKAYAAGINDFLTKPIQWPLFEYKTECLISHSKNIKSLMHEVNNVNRSTDMQNEYLNVISHEIRSPLHAIISYVRLGCDKSELHNETKFYKYFSTIGRSAENLLELVNSILDLDQLDAGYACLNISDGNLFDIVHEAITEFRLLASEKNLKITLDCSKDSYNIRMDNKRIAQVINNLLANAIKYSNENENIIMTIIEKKNNEILFTITNQCKPIEEINYETIFERYKRINTKEHTNGTGLGLPLCKAIIEEHQGKIGVVSDAGGTTFSFTLPYPAKQ